MVGHVGKRRRPDPASTVTRCTLDSSCVTPLTLSEWMNPMTIRTELATTFRRLHRPQDGSILILPNAWDALSARVIEQAGARAIATTSAGVS
jgi:hypothetical protein